jgi:NADH:ubiquinone oxidoreductase subunit C
MVKDLVKLRLEKKIRDWTIKDSKRIYFTIDKDDLKEVASTLYKAMRMRLSTVSGIDNTDAFELIYHFSCDKTGEIFNVRVFIKDKNNPEVDSLVGLFEASSWIEREIHEMLGIKFKGHPNLKHLLLDDDWPLGKYPLRRGLNEK